jgi:hypothetical protein
MPISKHTEGKPCEQRPSGSTSQPSEQHAGTTEPIATSI